MCRGNRRGNIFHEDEDFLTYLRILKVAKRRYPFFLYDYCLMTDHVHLQLQTLDYSISKIMQYINTVYANYYNSKYKVSGHLFQGDTIYIHDFSRLARSTKDLLDIVEMLNTKGISLISNKENLDTSTPTE